MRRAEAGLIRQGQAEIRIVSEDLTPDVITVIIVTVEGKKRVRFNWPDDFEMTAHGDGHEGRVRVPGIAAYGVVTNFVVRGSEAKIPAGDDWNLSKLFPRTEDDFERYYYRIRHRPADEETLAFAMEQVLDHYTLNQAHRCVASVIFGYKALDVGDPRMMTKAVAILEQELTRMGGMGDTFSARTDGNHLTMSMGMTLWQLHMGLGDTAAALAQIDSTIAFSRTIALRLQCMAYNLCRMILLRALICAHAGQIEESMGLIEYNFWAYTRTYQNPDPSTVRFTELLVAHKAVMLSLQLRDKIRVGKKPIANEPVFTVVNRVNSPAGYALMERSFGPFVTAAAALNIRPDVPPSPPLPGPRQAVT